VPLDLYVRHTSPVLNVLLGWLLPLIEPTRHDKTLRRFPNYSEMWAERQPKRASAADQPLAASTARSEILDQALTRSRKAR
jgi:hypothetical protein